ncbi:hypothetical protein, partial [Mycobacterium tuberculosis]|uniref:hypothetical protein n=1 Tax=Mycobacterium tuberculosis TaxID=1773 RepID=UPI001BE0F7E5
IHMSWLRFGHGLVLSSILLWTGVGVMLLAWLGLGRRVLAGEAQPRRSALRTGSELEKSRKVLDNSIFRCSQINRWSMARS